MSSSSDSEPRIRLTWSKRTVVGSACPSDTLRLIKLHTEGLCYLYMTYRKELIKYELHKKYSIKGIQEMML